MKSKVMIIFLVLFCVFFLTVTCVYALDRKDKFTLYLNDTSADRPPEPMSSALFLLGSGTLITRIIIRKKQKA